MITEIVPTPALVALLAEVEAGNVVEGDAPETVGHTWLLRFGHGRAAEIQVDNEMVDLAAAGWARLGGDRITWHPTPAVRAVLDRTTS